MPFCTWGSCGRAGASAGLWGFCGDADARALWLVTAHIRLTFASGGPDSDPRRVLVHRRCGYLAAVYLTGEAQRRGDASLQAYFTRRAQAAAIIAGALSLAALAELRTSNPALYARLTGRALPLRSLLARAAWPSWPSSPSAGSTASGSLPRPASPPSAGVGRRPVPGAAPRHPCDPDHRRSPARNLGRDHLASRRLRADRRALLRAPTCAVERRQARPRTQDLSGAR